MLSFHLFLFSLKLNEEFWQYNTFQYWRNPLPPIDLADLEDIGEGSLREARLQGKNEVVEVDMESWHKHLKNRSFGRGLWGDLS